MKTRQEELASATAETNEMEKMFEEAKAEAEAAKVKADEMAVAMDDTARRPRLTRRRRGGVQGWRIAPQTMAQITAAATQQEITAGELFTVAADKKKAWTDAALRQKTAQETLDHEVARNAELKVQSTWTRRRSSTRPAPPRRTPPRRRRQPQGQGGARSAREFAAAQDARKKAEEERDHLRFDIRHRAASTWQQRKTDALKAKAGVIDAVAGAARGERVEKIKANVLHDAQEAVDRKFYDAEAEAAKAALPRRRRLHCRQRAFGRLRTATTTTSSPRRCPISAPSPTANLRPPRRRRRDCERWRRRSGARRKPSRPGVRRQEKGKGGEGGGGHGGKQ